MWWGLAGSRRSWAGWFLIERLSSAQEFGINAGVQVYGIVGGLVRPGLSVGDAVRCRRAVWEGRFVMSTLEGTGAWD